MINLSAFKAYDVRGRIPDEINEEDLEAEFGALEEELALDQQSEAADLSSFLVAPSVPTSKVPRHCI